MSVKLNRRVKDFSAASTAGEWTLSAQRGTAVVVYFYPKDNTPGCTQEGQDFRDRHAQFKRAGAVIVGVSRDSLKKHENFKARFDFPFALISDSDEQLCQYFDVIREKKLYGKTYMGIDRSTFLIDAEGVLRQEWRSVQVKGHADAVLDSLRSL